MTWRAPAALVVTGFFMVILWALTSPFDVWLLRTLISLMAGWVAIEFWLSLRYDGHLMLALALAASTNAVALAWFVTFQAPIALGYPMPRWAVWMAGHTSIIWVPYALAVLGVIVELRLGRRR